MRFTMLTYFIFMILLVLNGCNIFNSKDNNDCVDIPEKNLPEEGTPTQFCIEESIEIDLIHNPGGVFVLDDEPTLSFTVFANDSTPHLNWLPTKLTVQTDQDFTKEILLHPYACIDLIENSTAEFPFNVEWWSCNRIGLDNEDILSSEEIGEIENKTDSRLTHRYQLHNNQGETYRFDLHNTGRSYIEEAINLIENLNYIKGDVFHANNFPECWLSDVIPPPPCPPWYLVNEYRISFEGEKENHIPVQEGGWVKASYTLPDGTVKSTTYTIPEIEQE